MSNDQNRMPARFVDLDRQTPMFLPYDLREWLPAGHIVHFILEAVEQIPTAHLGVNHRGSGSEQYPPHDDARVVALLLRDRSLRFTHHEPGDAETQRANVQPEFCAEAG